MFPKTQLLAALSTLTAPTVVRADEQGGARFSLAIALQAQHGAGGAMMQDHALYLTHPPGSLTAIRYAGRAIVPDASGRTLLHCGRGAPDSGSLLEVEGTGHASLSVWMDTSEPLRRAA